MAEKIKEKFMYGYNAEQFKKFKRDEKLRKNVNKRK
jgi:hypothetical protein